MGTTAMNLADLINSTYTDADARAASGDYLDIGEANDSEAAVADDEPCQVFDVPTSDSRYMFKYFEDFKKAVKERLLILCDYNTTEVNAYLAIRTNNDWQDYLKDFSFTEKGIAAVAGGIIAGLI